MSTKGKIITWIVAILLVASAILVYFKFYFVFGEGVKAGELNQIVYKGWLLRSFSGCGRIPCVPSTCAGDLRELLIAGRCCAAGVFRAVCGAIMAFCGLNFGVLAD